MASDWQMRAFGDISSLAAIAAAQTKNPPNIQNVAASVLVTSVPALERNNGVLCLLGGNTCATKLRANRPVYVSLLHIHPDRVMALLFIQCRCNKVFKVLTMFRI